MKYQDRLQTIGNTPVVRLDRSRDHLARALRVKVERCNPCGSIKDRPALNMIEDAERRGALQPGDTLVEPTSGNTGIGLAMVAAVKGYRAVFVMASDMSEERRALMRAFGAELILTPAELGTKGAVAEARRLADAHGWFFVGQHFNPANPEAHASTAAEIWEDFGTELDALVCTTGTGGTITGVGRRLKARNPALRVIATAPGPGPDDAGRGARRAAGRGPGRRPGGTHPLGPGLRGPAPDPDRAGGDPRRRCALSGPGGLQPGAEGHSTVPGVRADPPRTPFCRRSRS